MRRLLLPAAALLLAGAVAACSPEPATRVGIFIPLSVDNGAITYSPEGIATEALGVDHVRVHQVVGQRPVQELVVLEEHGVQPQLTVKSPQLTAAEKRLPCGVRTDSPSPVGRHAASSVGIPPRSRSFRR